jgi:hypothetical protein
MLPKRKQVQHKMGKKSSKQENDDVILTVHQNVVFSLEHKHEVESTWEGGRFQSEIWST